MSGWKRRPLLPLGALVRSWLIWALPFALLARALLVGCRLISRSRLALRCWLFLRRYGGGRYPDRCQGENDSVHIRPLQQEDAPGRSVESSALVKVGRTVEAKHRKAQASRSGPRLG